MIDHEKFPSIKRLSRGMAITEKIDGTNALVYVDPEGGVHAGSRSRWITPGKSTDNFGFAGWVAEHEDELREGLGEGLHYGEWWGAGIQRRYGLDHKRFSLFNAGRWTDDVRPECCYVVPTLFEGPFCTEVVDMILRMLEREGSTAAPGFMEPEGIVVWHTHARVLFKKTIGDDGHKGG